jgi:hypothetical protein
VDTDPWNYPPRDLRLSDADRDRALAELSEHFSAGRLTVEELDDWSGRIVRARTSGELADVLADLPRERASPPFPSRSRRLFSPRVIVAAVIVAAVLLIAVVGMLGKGHSHSGGSNSVLAVLPVAMVLLVVLSRRRGGEPGRQWRR